MVHVLSCHQFAGDVRTLSPSQEPLLIFSSADKLFVATFQRSIHVYELGKAGSSTADEPARCVCTFTTAGLVKQGVYSPKGRYIATLEEQGNPPNQLTSIRVYFNWELSGPEVAVRARIAGGDLQMQERGAATNGQGMTSDRPAGRLFELVEIPTPAPALCIGRCPATGHLAAAVDNTVSLHRLVWRVQSQRPELAAEWPDFEWMLQLRVGFLVREVQLCQGTVACMGSSEVQVMQLRLWDSTEKETVRSPSAWRPAQQAVPAGKRKVPPLIAQTDPSSSDDGLSAATTPSLKRTGNRRMGKSVADCQAQRYFVVEQDTTSRWDFGTEMMTGAGHSKSSSGQLSNSVLLPSVQSEEPYYDNLEVNCEMIGPSGRFEGHPSHILLPRKRSRRMKSSLVQLLYRRFDQHHDPNDLDKSAKILHSLQLLATYSTSSSTETRGGHDLLESDGAHQLASLCCFFSSARQGCLYELRPLTRLLTEYTYKADALQVRAGLCLLFALTHNGLETYTLRTTAAALPNIETIDDIHNTCPSASRDISLVGLEPYLGLTQITVSQNHVMLLSKSREVQREGPAKREMMANISSKSSTVYLHEQAALSTVYHSIMELGERYRQSSPAAYLQCMLEGHLMLRTALHLPQEGALTPQQDGDQPGEGETLQELYLQSCLQLALHYCRGENTDWHLALPYFNMSKLPLKKIIELSPRPYTSFEDEELMTGAGYGMVQFLDWVLFGEDSTAQADQDTADSILKYFISLAPEHCSKVVLLSKIADQLSPDKTLDVLFKVRDSHQPGQHVNFAGIPGRYTWGNMDRLALAVVYLRLGNLEQAASSLCTLSAEEITQLCIQYPSLLLLPGAQQFSHLAQLIRQQEPSSLISTLVQLLDAGTVSLSVCIKLLRDEGESLASSANSHLKRFLEEVVSARHRHAVLPEAARLLLEVYFERLLKGLSKGNPLRQSSRHTHIFSNGGCFHKTSEWMDYLPPIQGPESLTLKCFQDSSPVGGRPGRGGFMGRLPPPLLAKLGGAPRPGHAQSPPGRPASRAAEAEMVCPCCCCNDDLLSIQSLITSPCASPALASFILDLITVAMEKMPIGSTPTGTTPIKTTPTKTTPTKTTPTKTTPSEATPTKATPAETTATKATPAEATPTKATPTRATPAETTPTKATHAETTPTKATPSETTPTKASPSEATPTKATPSGITPSPSACAMPQLSAAESPLTAADSARAPPTSAPPCPRLIQSLRSLAIICQSVLDPPAVLPHLVRDHPALVLDYAQETFGQDTAKWIHLLKMLLAQRPTDARPPSATSKDHGDSMFLCSQTDYLQLLTGVLSHTSHLLGPDELLQCLPSEGSLSFFLPYIRQSCSRLSAKALQERLVHSLAVN